MTTRPRLILHIGYPKTGTTSLQKTCVKHAEQLAAQGFRILSLEGQRTRGHASGCCNLLVRRDKIDLEKLEHHIKKTPGNLIISAESMIRVGSLENLRATKQLLDKYYAEVKVVAYLRRQDHAAVSHKQQVSKISAGATLRFQPVYEFDRAALPKNRNVDLLNYEERMGLWGDVFGDENLILRVYERSELEDGDVTADFLHAVGLRLNTTKVAQRNSTFGKSKMYFLLSLLERGGLGRELALFRPHIPDDRSEKLLPSGAQAKAFYEHFREGNLRLNERFHINERPSIFGEDFSSYPEVPGDEPDVDDWIKILKLTGDTLRSMQGRFVSQDEAILLRRASMALAKRGKLRDSYKMLQLARRVSRLPERAEKAVEMVKRGFLPRDSKVTHS